jgi:hypothetical protein
VVEVTSTGASIFGDYLTMAGRDLGLGGTVTSYVNALASLMSIPDRINKAWKAQDIANGYEAMYENLQNLQFSECYNRLSLGQKIGYSQFYNSVMEANSDIRFFKWSQTFHSIAVNTVTVATATASILPLGVGQVGRGLAKIGTSMFSLLAGSVDLDIFGDKIMTNQYNAYKKMYDSAQEWNEILKSEMALACGKKDSNRVKAVYNISYDPQGVVYDSTLDYPVAGVRAELWTAADGDGIGARYWEEAEDFEQINPQITEADGMFQWFTPEGYW